jgi:hypothetical protein
MIFHFTCPCGKHMAVEALSEFYANKHLELNPLCLECTEKEKDAQSRGPREGGNQEVP